MPDKDRHPNPPSTPVSKVQIAANEKRIQEMESGRPQPRYTIEHTPTGPVRRAVDEEVVNQENARIDRETEMLRKDSARQQDRLDQHKDLARDAFQRAINKGRARDAFDRSR